MFWHSWWLSQGQPSQTNVWKGVFNLGLLSTAQELFSIRSKISLRGDQKDHHKGQLPPASPRGAYLVICSQTVVQGHTATWWLSQNLILGELKIFFSLTKGLCP